MAAIPRNNPLLARQARALFIERAAAVLPELQKAIGARLAQLADQAGSALEMQERRDARLAYQGSAAVWVDNTVNAWRKALSPSDSTSRVALDSSQFELMSNEVMENKILASRLALRLLDFASWELNDLRLRVQSLEGISELPKNDILRPELLAQKLTEQWILAPLTRESWRLVQDLIQQYLAEHLLEAYHAANEFLVGRGVMAEIDLRPLVRRTPSALRAPANAPGLPDSARAPAGPTGFSGRATSGGDAATTGRPQDETRMETAATPMARARMRAQGVLGHLKRMLSTRVAGYDDTQPHQPSWELAQAFAKVQGTDQFSERTVLSGTPDQHYGAEHVDQAAAVLRQRTSTLKLATSNSSERATIEIVALMFQSILAEDRIPAAVRVWFARLQMPVLRVAISEPEFFGSLQHPARRLIDRMGSCVLGFDATIGGGEMEAEIKRVVQVIEQYPETGRRVFQLVYDEFQKFLSRFLSGQDRVARVVTVAQQVEQKETLAIQYTIEMRNILSDMPVREEIRDFLFKVWAEVLAIAAMKNGPQHEETMLLKRAATDLVWSVSAKTNRSDRARVIADLPQLLLRLRSGMLLLGTPLKLQDLHIKLISDTLADAFMSKTDVISNERMELMAKRLINLEDYLSEEDVGDLPLDAASLVMMIGIDASDLQVITDGGSQPGDAMRAWAEELQLGAWFSLDHNGQLSHVQFAWRSERKQLHLFASADGRNFLIQARRLAAYLQAGLLVPTEEEALTVRATRNALAKIDANPERLLS